jgi:hypothetical protein
MLKIFMLRVIMMRIFMLSFIRLNVIMPSIVVLNVIMLGVILLAVIMLSVTAPTVCLKLKNLFSSKKDNLTKNFFTELETTIRIDKVGLHRTLSNFIKLFLLRSPWRICQKTFCLSLSLSLSRIGTKYLTSILNFH